MIDRVLFNLIVKDSKNVLDSGFFFFGQYIFHVYNDRMRLVDSIVLNYNLFIIISDISKWRCVVMSSVVCSLAMA